MELQPATVGDACSRILLVDAADDEREMYALALRAQGYLVRESDDGEGGLIEARTAPPDLVVADVVLPKLDGLQLLAAIRSLTATRDLPVIILTGYDQPLNIITEAKAAGATAVRIKPCLPETLVREVRHLLEECRRLREKSAEVRMRSQETRARAANALARAIDFNSRNCPACGTALKPVGVVRASLGHVYFRPCPQGCGWWYYDTRTCQMSKLL
jgi:DNA-binding response OmpR family regulator